MRTMFPTMLDRPETPRVIGSILYSILAFWSLPFILLLLMQGSFEHLDILSGIEIAYYVINFGAAVCIFFHYMKDSFINVQINVRGFWTVVGVCSAVVVATAFFLYLCCMFVPYDFVAVAGFSILPLTEKELFAIPSALLSLSPVMATICMVFLAPVSISCLFYAAIFAPVCNDHPKLAYLAVTAYIAVPTLCNALTYWNPAEEIAMYVVQLPIHLLACWAYQKTDTIWAPIAIHGITNAVGCGIWFVMNTLI